MQRGSDRLSVHRDDEMKHELRGLLRSGHPTRVDEWHDPEPAADDDLAVVNGPVLSGATDGTSLPFELARHLTRKTFPARRGDLLRALRDHHAPDPLTDLVDGLPGDNRRYANVQEVVRTLGMGPRA
ncbi:DUF2795 domain-containing protein [Streptomyces sp. NPDC058691]|uniref:DUF2795 domain-containing protein n=1 Tax=Streptomyces sp. NPDC058691 TaxID=3346601 RepID=UPI003653F1C9